MRRAIVVILAITACLAGALAAGGQHYVNVWYNYAIDLPPGFSAVNESANGDGGFSHSGDGQSSLAVWGSGLVDSLAADVQSRIQGATDDGWNVSYSKVTGRWASWSGEKNGRIFYARAIAVCDGGRAAYFQLDYPQAARDAFDPVIKQLLKDFKATDCN